MKRYTIKTEVMQILNPFDCEIKRKVASVLEESSEGEFVRWSDVEAMRKELEAQIPEIRLKRIEDALGLVHNGQCPECRRMTRGWESPTGCLAPEIWATLRESGIDARTGHKFGCSLAAKAKGGGE